MAEMRRINVIVTGLVQGVGYRYYTLVQAQQLGLSGWVRNLPDGRVEVVAQGNSVALVQLLEALKSGPNRATVEGAVVDWLEPEQLPVDKFSVRY